MATMVFNRVEKKYKLNEEKYQAFWSDLIKYMEIDEFGRHTISNIYYDTPDDLLIRRSIEKPVYKEKLRLRSYGRPTLNDNVFLEIKKKYDGIVNKRRIALPLQNAYDYMNKNISPFPPTQILSELDYFKSLYHLSPKLLLSYERIALYGKEDPTFRVTFDTGIRSRTDNLRLEKGSYGNFLFKDACIYLMEVKITNSTPLWFSKLLSKHQIYPTSFSKYGNVYKEQMLANNSQKTITGVANADKAMQSIEDHLVAV